MLRNLALLLALLLCAVPAHAKSKTLVAASNPTWPPMEFLSQDKQITGYDRDIVDAIAKEAGLAIKFQSVAWDGIFAALESGQADLIASCVTITDKRKKNYLFSDPYYEVQQAIIVAKNANISGPADLKDKTVGIQIGTTAAEALRKMDLPMTIRTYDDVGLVFEDMRNGRLDAVVCDDPVGRYYASRKEGYENLMKLAFLTDDVEHIGFVFKKSDADLVQRFNEGLAKIRANGVEKAIRTKWLGE